MLSQNQIQIVPVQSVSPVSQTQFSSGSSVFVRVIGMDVDGSYLVSAGGNRLTVHSQNSMDAGQTFIAQVKVDSDGKVLLEPRFDRPVEQSRSADSMQSFLYDNGIEPGDIAFRVLQFMEQSGLKIDRSLMEKAQIFGKKFKGREKLASEAAAILLQKGINPTDDNILALMSISVGDYGEGGNAEKDGKESDKKESGNFLRKLYPLGAGSGEGLLTYMNHVSNGKKHWVFLPYEYALDKENARGVMRILLDLQSEETEKILLNCELNSTKFFFVIYCLKSKGKEVRFFTLPPLLPSKVKAEELRLGGFLSSGMNIDGPVTVTYSDSACSDGLCTVDEIPLMVETQA